MQYPKITHETALGRSNKDPVITAETSCALSALPFFYLKGMEMSFRGDSPAPRMSPWNPKVLNGSSFQ